MKKRQPITITLDDLPEPMLDILEERAMKEGKDVDVFLREMLMERLLETAVQAYDNWLKQFRKLSAEEQGEIIRRSHWATTEEHIKNMRSLRKAFKQSSKRST